LKIGSGWETTYKHDVFKRLIGYLRQLPLYFIQNYTLMASKILHRVHSHATLALKMRTRESHIVGNPALKPLKYVIPVVHQ
jgi:hypothetical protein